MDTDDLFYTKSHWDKIGVNHHHGICINLMGLHTHVSGGIGEYLDLIPLLSWLKTTGFDTVQLLPLNDTGSHISPYMGLSGSALHPIYISLLGLENASSYPELQRFHLEAKEASSETFVNYPKVLAIKETALRYYLSHTLPSIEENSLYKKFLQKEKSWLVPYSIFKALKHVHNQTPFWEWKIQPSLETIVHDDHLLHEIRIQRAIQFLCFEQMRAVHAVAKKQNILLVGDLPILIGKDSADVWYHPHLFSTTTSVGAPPDMYNKNGQAWGFPLYKWNAHKKEQFTWWKNRLRVFEEFYDLFRLDHVVGFYRFFTIPKGKTPQQGSWTPKDQNLWRPQGETILKHLLQSTTMLPLAEDLGDVPSLVRNSLHALGIPGLKVTRWEKRYDADRSFIHPRLFSPESVTTLSTHDSTTCAQFWVEEPLEAAQMAATYGFPYEPSYTPSIAKTLLSIAHASGSLFHINLLPEYLQLFPELSHKTPHEDRINIPGTVSHTNWVRRYRTPLETIISHIPLLHLLQKLSQKPHIYRQ